jgi:VIT1/CCC1 family predicted Fe2+/Mn2+ transporter
MSIFLWVLQAVLAVKFVSVAHTHGFRRDKADMQRGIERMGAVSRPLLTLVAVSTFLAAVGLILPAVLRVLSWLVPFSAALLALMVLVGIGFHVICRERPKIVVGLVLFVLAAFVAYGRWMIAPL